MKIFDIPICFVVLYLLLPATPLAANQISIQVQHKEIHLPFWLGKGKPSGAVILLTSNDASESMEVFTDMARFLSLDGWSTVILSATMKDKILFRNQLSQSIRALRMINNKRIVLVHYGGHVKNTIEYFNQTHGKSINGLVLLSAFEGGRTMDYSGRVRISTIDILGQFDYTSVIEQQRERKRRLRTDKYLFVEIPGAYHDYGYNRRVLARTIERWMLGLSTNVVELPPIWIEKQ